MGRSGMLQRLGIVTAIAGSTPELLAVLESMTAQRQDGFLPMVLTCLQQPAETAAFSSDAADAQGASLKASISGDDLPHSPAPSTPLSTLMLRTTRNARKQILFIDASISSMQYAKHYLAKQFIEKQEA